MIVRALSAPTTPRSLGREELGTELTVRDPRPTTPTRAQPVRLHRHRPTAQHPTIMIHQCRDLFVLTQVDRQNRPVTTDHRNLRGLSTAIMLLLRHDRRFD